MGDNKEITLFYCQESFFSQKVLFSLHEKKLDFKPRIMSLAKSEQCEPWFLKQNPAGKIPCMQHGDTFMAESTVCLKYLDEQYEPKLQPDITTDYGKRVSHFQELLESLDIPTLSFGCLFAPEHFEMDKVTFVRLSSRGRVEGKEFVKKMAVIADQHPELKETYDKKIQIASDMFDKMQKPECIDAAVKHADKVFAEIEAELKLRPEGENWLCGPDFTVADINMAVTLHRLDGVGLSKRLFSEENNPLVGKYYERLPKIYPKYVEICVEGSKHNTAGLPKN